MGEAYRLKCSRCDYEIFLPFGVGMFFPHLYSDTIDRIKKGRFGKTAQKFLQGHPDGAIDCEKTVFICERCGALKQGLNLDMYIPKPGHEQFQHSAWSIAFPFHSASYADKTDLEQHCTLYQHYPHRCPKCRKRMQALSPETFVGLLDKREFKCPDCNSALELCDLMLWD